MNNNVMMINVNTRKQSNTAQFQLEKRKMPAFILCSRQSRLQLRLGPPKKPGLGENRNGKNFLGDTCVSSFAPAGALPFVSGRGPPSFSVKDQRVTIFDPRGPLISLPHIPPFPGPLLAVLSNRSLQRLDKTGPGLGLVLGLWFATP